MSACARSSVFLRGSGAPRRVRGCGTSRLRRLVVAPLQASVSGRRNNNSKNEKPWQQGRKQSKRLVVSRDVMQVGKDQGSSDSKEEGAALEGSVLKLNIQGRHLKVTESLRRYVESQVEKATTHFMLHHHDVNKGKNAPISRVDVRLSARGGPKHQTKGPQLQKAEVTVFTTIGVVRAEVELDNAYNAIDEAGRTVERKLRKLKEKAIAKGVWNGHGIRPKHKKKKQVRNPDVDEDEVYFTDAEAEDFEMDMASRWETTESYVEQNVPSQTKGTLSDEDVELKIYRKKEVDLIPMAVEDAVESLQFLGHDFFMFLDKEDKEIKVVYKRDVAGFGVLSPKLPPNY